MERAIIIGAGVVIGIMILFAVINPPSAPEPGDGLKGVSLPVDPPDSDWFAQQVIAAEVPVVVDFRADWCGPCRMLDPILKRLETEYEGQLAIQEVDVDENPDIAAHYSVSGIPRVLVFHRGKPVDGFTGVHPYETIEAMVLPYLSADSPPDVVPEAGSTTR